ncbi:Transcription termination factor MTERF15 mitochondrial [Bienertia sinuspersici]
MFKLLCNNNGVKALYFFNGFHRLLFSSKFCSITENGNLCFANYLVGTLGFSKQNARLTSTKLEKYLHSRGTKKVIDSKFFSNADAVIEFLKQNGLNNSQIGIAVSSSPKVLLSKTEKTLKPKIDFFLNFGFSKSDFGQVVSANPYVLLGNRHIRAIEALKDVFSCDSDVIIIMKKCYWISVSSISNNLIPNVALLRDYGLPVDLIRKRLLTHPIPFLRKKEAFKELLMRVEKTLGVPCDSPKFLTGIHVLSSVSEKNLDSKIIMFEKFGWMRTDVLALVRANPYCLALSEARIKKSLEYFAKELGYDIPYLISHSALFGYSLENRIVPRNRVFSALKEKGLIRCDYSLYSTLHLKESRFLEKYVLPFDQEIHEIYAKHKEDHC